MDNEWVASIDKRFLGLTHAKVVAFGPVYMNATILPQTGAYRKLRRDLSSHPEWEAHLPGLLRVATPAGRIYLGALFRRWDGLLDDHAEVETLSACFGGTTTVAEYATWLKDHHPDYPHPDE